jgi:hypothetical protein
MDIDLLTIPNFFQNPKRLLDLAKRQKFYTRAENPEPQFVEDPEIFYWGARSLPLSSILESTVYDLLLREYFDRLFQTIDPPKGRVGFEVTSTFHSLTEEDKVYENDGLHQDSTLYAGVVYLNDIKLEDPQRHGTIVLKNDEEVNVPYEYNKLVLYSGKYFHSANEGFGNDLDSSRLTLNMFFNVKEIG